MAALRPAFCALLTLALAGACSNANFGGSGIQKAADAKKNTDGHKDDGVDENGKDGGGADAGGDGVKPIYVPVGGTKNIPGSDHGKGNGEGGKGADCKIADKAIASCAAGTVTGNKVGTTSVHSGDKDIPVIVYDPKNPPPGALGDGSDSGGGTDSTTDVAGKAGSEDGALGTSAKPAIDEGEIIAKIPGVEVVKVGVNFEDLGLTGDRDYNDAVLCFQGNFKVDGSNIVSIKAQQVVGTTSSISGCRHKVRVEITHADGTKEPNIEYDSRAAQPVTMNFKVGTKMEVFMTPYQGCSPGVQHTMHEPDYAKVQPNLCNTTGQ